MSNLVVYSLSSVPSSIYFFLPEARNNLVSQRRHLSAVVCCWLLISDLMWCVLRHAFSSNTLVLLNFQRNICHFYLIFSNQHSNWIIQHGLLIETDAILWHRVMKKQHKMKVQKTFDWIIIIIIIQEKRNGKKTTVRIFQATDWWDCTWEDQDNATKGKFQERNWISFNSLHHKD